MPDRVIQYLRRDQIDTTKWNERIDKSTNGAVYAYAYYLDIMAQHWDALVMGNYDVVMPLTWNKKFGIHYLYQPAFTASLGVFGDGLSEDLLGQFIRMIPAKFRLVEIPLNRGNNLVAGLGISQVRHNYILSLNRPYDELYKGYRENVRRNVKKSGQLGARYEDDMPVSSILELSKQQMQRVSQVSDSDYIRFQQLYDSLKKKNQAIACGVYLNDQLLASAVYFFSHGRAYYILVGNHPNGKTIGASHFLIDRFIYDHADRNLILDFEGSDIQSLAFFYSSFGATLETYPALRIDKLPWWVKLLRRSPMY